MIINSNSQLGLQFWDKKLMLDFLGHSKICLDQEINRVIEIDESGSIIHGRGDEIYKIVCDRLSYKPELKGTEFYTIKNPKPYWYLIQNTVEKCASMIRINENFSCSIFNKIKDGEHCYLLGKNEFFRFVKFNNAIRGMFWNRLKKISFEVAFILDMEEYYFMKLFSDDFNRMLRLMIFIELGDVEITEIEKGGSNRKSKKDGKIINASNNNVYIIDSSWNKIIIRTTGFAVMGHFRLQPYGKNNADRKLIFIQAFEKHGYKRRPKAQILN